MASRFVKVDLLCQYYKIPKGEEDDPEYRFGGAVLPKVATYRNIGGSDDGDDFFLFMLALKRKSKHGNHRSKFDQYSEAMSQAGINNKEDVARVT